MRHEESIQNKTSSCASAEIRNVINVAIGRLMCGREAK
jgi:hypothetical protein